METFLDNFHQGGKCSAQIASHKAKLRRKEKFTDQKYLPISSLQTDYLYLYRTHVLEEIFKKQTMFIKNAPFVDVLPTFQKKKSKGSERKSKNLVRLVICTTDERNGRLRTFLDVDMNIT